MYTQSRSLPRIGVILAVLIAVLFAAQALPARAAQPTVTALNPTSGSTLGGTVVTITGTDFIGATGVEFDGVAGTGFVVNNATTITVTSPAHAAGSVDVIVQHPDGASANTAADNFNYVAPSVPTVTGVSPNIGPTAGGTTVTITGTNFVGLASTGDVTFGGTVAAYIVQSPTSIVATAPPHAAGTVQVEVTNPSGPSADTAADNFTYGATAPTVTNVSPAGGPIAGGNLVVLTGTGFSGVTGAAGVTFGGTNAASYTVNSDTQITALAPAHAVGTVNILVTHPTGGTSVNTPGDDYTYGNVPTVTGLAPGSGNIAGGQLVVITGTGFTGVTGAPGVKFDANNATSYTVNSDTQITATAPAHAAGVVDVTVTSPAGTSANTAADNFTYTAGPVITGIAPASGGIAGGTSVVITGTGFTGATAVSFGGVAATAFTVNGATQITATAPAHAAGTVSIAVTTPLGTSVDTAADNFLYGSGPSISSISPAQGPIAGGTVVTITGTGFTGATAVAFGGAAATSFTVVSDTTITAVSPAAANGVVRISVTTPIGTSADTAADNYTYGTGATKTYTLFFRWTLIVWGGKDNANIATALAGQETPDNPQTNSISGIVTAVFHYNNPQQRFEAWFPGGAGIPGANDISAFDLGEPYWVAISQSGQATWTVLTD